MLQDEELLRFIDIECYCWSTVDANLTPMMNAGMVFCDRHYGGINYPRGGEVMPDWTGISVVITAFATTLSIWA